MSRLYEHNIHDEEAYCSKHGWYYAGYTTCPTCHNEEFLKQSAPAVIEEHHD